MIPDWLREKLATPPAAGNGLHGWLFSVARQLHAHMPPEAVAGALFAATASVNASRQRDLPREIRDAVNNSHAVRWQPAPKSFDGMPAGQRTALEPSKAGESGDAGLAAPDTTSRHSVTSCDRWPKPCADRRRVRIEEAAVGGVPGLADLWERSPVRPEVNSADDWLDLLFPGAQWLCLAVDHPATARSRLRERWSFGSAEDCGLVVPSPMTGPSGRGLDGRNSHRCLGNTGPRCWLVIEFDAGTIDEQAALHWHLRGEAGGAGWPRLTLCVHSGGKSLHGWYGPVASEEAAHDLMAYAVSLGADPATWNRCQLVRLPGGVRDGIRTADGVELPEGWEAPPSRARLEVFFYDPSTQRN